MAGDPIERIEIKKVLFRKLIGHQPVCLYLDTKGVLRLEVRSTQDREVCEAEFIVPDWSSPRNENFMEEGVAPNMMIVGIHPKNGTCWLKQVVNRFCTDQNSRNNASELACKIYDTLQELNGVQE